MSSFRIPPPWQSGYAIPGYIRSEGLQNRAYVTKWTPRGSYDTSVDPRRPTTDRALATPRYWESEGYGQGAYVTEWAPRGFYVGHTQQRIRRNQKALGEHSGHPAEVAGSKMAAQILTEVRQLPATHQKQHLRAMLQAIHPSLWDKTATFTQKYVDRAVGGPVALELGLARALSETTHRVALGDTVPSGAIFTIFRTDALATPSAAAPAVQAGACSADGKFIWTIASNGTGYWKRLGVNEQCKSTADVVGPTIRTGGGGGVEVTPTTVMKVGPFTIPVVRPGNQYTWGLDDVNKLTADQAALLKTQLTKKIDYPGRSNWIAPGKASANDQSPGLTSTFTFDNGDTITSTWPATAPWGQGWISYVAWLRTLGIDNAGYDARYLGFDRGKYAPVATFVHPSAPEGGRGSDGTNYERYGLWVRIQPVGPDIPAMSSTKVVGGVQSPLTPPIPTKSHQLQFMIAPLPDKSWLGDFMDWIMKGVLTVVAGFYDAVIDVGKTLSDALCAMAQDPNSVQTAAKAGGPYAAAGAAANKLLIGGSCPVPLPPDTGEPERAGWLIPVAIGGAIIAAGMLLPKKRKSP